MTCPDALGRSFGGAMQLRTRSMQPMPTLPQTPPRLPLLFSKLPSEEGQLKHEACTPLETISVREGQREVDHAGQTLKILIGNKAHK